MTRATVAGTLLAADADARRLRYLLLPYGEEGRTNLGRVTASRGAVTIPDRVSLNIEHDRTRPVGWADRADFVETVRGLEASFTIAPTTAGDDLLTEARSGLRAGASVELEPVVIRAGAIVSGMLAGAGAVAASAFPSAQLVAADAGDLPDGMPEDEDSRTTSEDHIVIDGVEYVRKTTSTYTTETTRADGEGDDNEEEGTVPENTQEGTTPATAPAGGLAASRAATDGARALRAAGPTRSELVSLMASAHKAGGARGLTAALADVVPANILGIEQPQYVGQLWDGKAYTRKFVPLFNHADLTSYSITGWRWVTRPSVAAWAGNKTDVPSAAIETEPVTVSAERIAGAHDIDRKFRDFNDQEFFNAYLAAMTESYAQVSDITVLADAVAAATDVVPGTVPTDVPAALAYIVDGALSILAATDTMPTFAIVQPALWRDLILTPKDHTVEYLNTAFGLEEGSTEGFRIIPSSQAPAGGVLVGTRAAMTVHELGGSPIRVEALDVSKGGIDNGLFGYLADNVHDSAGLASVVPAAG